MVEQQQTQLEEEEGEEEEVLPALEEEEEEEVSVLLLALGVEGEVAVEVQPYRLTKNVHFSNRILSRSF